MTVKKRSKRITIRFELIPMIDVMMILCLFLSIMAFLPQFTHVIETQLPKTRSEEKAYNNVNVNINKNGTIYLNEFSVTKNELGYKIKELIKINPNQAIIISADKGLSYDFVVSIIDIIKKNGGKKVALATETLQ